MHITTHDRYQPVLHDYFLALFGFGFRNQARRRYAVVFFHPDQAHSLGRPTRLPDFARIDADHLAVAGDDHQFGIVLHRENPDHLAGLVGGLHVDNAFDAAVGEPVILHLRALPVAVLGNRQDHPVFHDHFGSNDEIASRQIHATDTVCRPAHRADLILRKADRLTI